MSVSLSVVFTGLCALVGDGNGGPGQVLLLDAKNVGSVHGVMLPAHAPTLVIGLNDLANPDSSNPSRVIVSRAGPTGGMEQLGLWDLSGSEVRIRTQGGEKTGLRFFKPDLDETSWPQPPSNVNDPGSWRDIRYVADMSALVGDGRIDPAVVGDGDPLGDGSPRSVAARILLESGILEGGIPSQASYRDDVFEFKSSRGIHRQAMTDTVQWTFESEATAVAIDIIPVAGGPVKRLLLAPSATPHRINVSNLPLENLSHADAHSLMSDDAIVALHFGAYYNLLLNEPADRPLPELWHPNENPMGSGFGRPAFCGLAKFARP